MDNKEINKVAHNLDSVKTLADLITLLGVNSHWVLALLIAAPIALPLPAIGFAQLLAVPLILVLFAKLFGRNIWLPKWVLKIKLSQKLLKLVLEKIYKTIAKDESLNQTSNSFWHKIFSQRFSAIVCLLACCCVLVPLPLTNSIPSVGIFFVCLGNIFAKIYWKLLGYAIVIGGFFITAAIIFYGAEFVRSLI